ncbi:STAS domain-containing protein [Nocardioides lianchengensis]|uniref:STAS domain-containing protein n=1 Tax=Nocardioides lianchengensis TaxID=1045774 RepID=UPI00211C5F31|nr:STAS domain-containing protein [Nocardioides lianchengensis]
MVLDGSLDLGAHDHLLAVVSDLSVVLGQITVDLSGVTFMDCAGITALLGAHQIAATAGSRLDIIAVSRAAWRMIVVAQGIRPYPRDALRLPASTTMAERD